MTNNSKAPLWVRSDFDAAAGVFFDGFSKVIAGTSVMVGMMSMPNDIVYGKIVPAVGLSVLLLNLFFWWQGRQLAEKTGRDDVTAIPSGVSAGRVFIFLFAIMLPTYFNTGDPVLAWMTGCAAHFISSFFYIGCALIAPKLLKFLPKAALFGMLAGGAIGWLGINSIGSIINMPVAGYVALMVMLVFYLGKINLKVPVAMVSIGAGTVIAWLMKDVTAAGLSDSVAYVGLSLPWFNLGFFATGIAEAMKFLPIIIVFSFSEAISSIQGVEQAIEGGDDYDVNQSLIVTGLVGIVSSLLGNPLPLGIFWGHVTWKKVNAGTGYSLGLGLFYVLICFSGVVAVINGIIPAAVTLPMLVYIAMTSAGQTFEVTEKKYYPVAVFAIMIPVIEVINGKIGSAANAGVAAARDAVAAAGVELDLSAVSVGLDTLQQNGVDALGFDTMAKGATFTALILGAMLCYVVDNNWYKASLMSLVAALFSFVGITHGATIGWNINPTFTLIYLGTALFFGGMGILKVGRAVGEEPLNGDA